MTYNPILKNTNRYFFDSEPQRIHYSLPNKEQVAHYVESEGLHDKSFFETLKKQKYNKDVAIALIDKCLQDLSDKSPHFKAVAIEWLTNYLDAILKYKHNSNPALDLLINRCKNFFIEKINNNNKLHISLPVLFIVRNFCKDKYFLMIKDKNASDKIDECIKNKIGNSLQDLQDYCAKEKFGLNKELPTLHESLTYRRYTGTRYNRNWDLRTSTPDQKKYSSEFIVNNNSRRYNNNDYDNLNVNLSHNTFKTVNKIGIFEYFGGMCSTEIPENLKYYNDYKEVVHYYLEQARNYLKGYITEEAPKNLFGMQIDATKGIQAFLKEICRHPQDFSQLYNDFLSDCEGDYKSSFQRLLRNQGIRFHGNVENVEDRHRLLMTWSSILEPEPIGLWYCLRTEFGRFGGVNSDYHENLKNAINQAGLDSLFLTKDGEFLEEYDANVLIKAMDVHIVNIQRQEQLLRREYFHYVNGYPDQDSPLSVQAPTEEQEEKTQED